MLKDALIAILVCIIIKMANVFCYATAGQLVLALFTVFGVVFIGLINVDYSIKKFYE